MKTSGSTMLLVDQRRNQVYDWMCSGLTATQVATLYKKHYPALTMSALELDKTHAYKRWRKDNPLEKVAAQHGIWYDKIIADSIGTAYTRDTALRAMSGKEKLLGVHKPETQINIQNNTLKMDNLSKDELTQMILNLDSSTGADNNEVRPLIQDQDTSTGDIEDVEDIETEE